MEEQFIITNRDAKKLWDKLFGVEYTVESMDYFRKKEGVKYTVKHKGDDSWCCDCKSYIFSSGTFSVTMTDTGNKHDKTCKHIRFVMKEENMPFKSHNRW